MNDSYLEYKINEARNKVFLKFNRIKNFTLEDVINLLSDYGKTFETTLDNLSCFITHKGNDFSSIKSFTKGFILDEEAHVLVCASNKHLDVFVVSFKHYLLANYFSLNINQDILNILYMLEVMKTVD